MGEEKNTKWKYVPDMGHHMLPQAEICCRDQDEKLVAAQISEEQAAQFLKHSETEQENAVWDNGWLQEKLDMLRASGNHFLLLLWGEHEEKCLLFLSDTKRVRPLEFLDYLMPDFGLIRGDVSCASVRVSSVILKLQMEAQGTEKTIEYLMNQAESYFRDCDWIDAREYGEAHTEEIKNIIVRNGWRGLTSKQRTCLRREQPCGSVHWKMSPGWRLQRQRIHIL